MESKSKAADRLSIVIACLSFLLDHIVYSVIVPIVPLYLHSRRYNKSEVDYGNQVFENGSLVRLSADGDSTESWNARHEDLMIGILFGSKAMMQALFTFVSGPMIDRFGCPLPMLTGISILLLSTLVFAFGKSYAVLFLARSIQGVGSAFGAIGAFSLLANQFKDEPEDSPQSTRIRSGLYLSRNDIRSANRWRPVSVRRKRSSVFASGRRRGDTPRTHGICFHLQESQSVIDKSRSCRRKFQTQRNFHLPSPARSVHRRLRWFGLPGQSLDVLPGTDHRPLDENEDAVPPNGRSASSGCLPTSLTSLAYPRQLLFFDTIQVANGWSSSSEFLRSALAAC